MAASPLPPMLANAWCGEAAQGVLAQDSLAWGAKRDVVIPRQSLAAPVVDYDNWRDARVGWGVVLADQPGLSNDELALGSDAPEPIRQLMAARGSAPVFRYVPGNSKGLLRRYRVGGKPSDLNLSGERGLGTNAVPWYLLIVGSPKEVPWEVQYHLQTQAYVGRLDLDLEGLENYVEALLNEWSGSPRSARTPIVWAVDKGHPDITRLMRKTIAERLVDKLKVDKDVDMAQGFLTDGTATCANLVSALMSRQPAFVMTSSHGATFPLTDPKAMAAQMGGLVDVANAVLVDQVKEWKPSGAIWYAHACCSAGGDAVSLFAGLVDSASTLGQTLTAIAQAGAQTSPLARSLLGKKAPLGAFVGHVEPTFDWTLRDPVTKQTMTEHITRALYDELHLASRPTIGRAMAPYFAATAGSLLDYADALDDIDKQGNAVLGRARTAKLLALDRLAMVILGDPTVRLPPP